MSTLERPPIPATPVRTVPHAVSAVHWACAMSLLAAAAHVIAAPSHLSAWWAYGLFFLGTAAGQAAFGVLVLVRQWTWLLMTSIVGNLAIVGMYIVSRTNGTPLGPHSHVEPVGLLDVTCTACELGIIVACVALLRPALARATTTALMTAGALLWIARFTGLLG
jgi:hypothetical protein